MTFLKVNLPKLELCIAISPRARRRKIKTLLLYNSNPSSAVIEIQVLATHRSRRHGPVSQRYTI